MREEFYPPTVHGRGEDEFFRSICGNVDSRITVQTFTDERDARRKNLDYLGRINFSLRSACEERGMNIDGLVGSAEIARGGERREKKIDKKSKKERTDGNGATVTRHVLVR